MSQSLQIDGDLFEQASRCARQDGASVRELVEDLLREYVADANNDDAVQRVWARMDRSINDADPGLDDFEAAA